MSGSVTPGVMITRPSVRSVWIRSSGRSASGRGSLARRGQTYHLATSEYVTSVAVVCKPKIADASISPPATDRDSPGS